jgi:nitrogen fixation/metabolism regulation signal transduction histidine kinase
VDTRTIKRAAIAAAGAIGLSLVALFLLGQTAQNSSEFDRLHIIILLISVAGVVVLFALLVGNLARLLRDYRNHVPGSKLKARMVGMFVGLAVLPLLVVFYFSMQFINRGIDSWFNVEVEAGFDDALELRLRQVLMTRLSSVGRPWKCKSVSGSILRSAFRIDCKMSVRGN